MDEFDTHLKTVFEKLNGLIKRHVVALPKTKRGKRGRSSCNGGDDDKS